MRLLIDTDPGMGTVGADPEDCLAILYALGSPDVSLEGLTVVNGNVPLADGHANARHLVHLVDRTDMHVVPGAAEPSAPEHRARQLALARRGSLPSSLPTMTASSGTGGSGGYAADGGVTAAGVSDTGAAQFAATGDGADEDGPVPRGPDGSGTDADNPAARFLCDMVMASPGEITLVAIGPLTNVAAAMGMEPGFGAALGGLVLMAGTARVGGNITPAAEFNVWVDPEAAAVVFDSEAPITMVGLDVCHRTAFDRSGVETLRGSGSEVASFAAEASAGWIEVREAADHGGGALHLYDSLAVAAAIDPTLVTCEEAVVAVETGEGPAQGMTVTYLNPVLRPWFTDREPNVAVATGVDTERFHALFAERVINRL